jgi:hypothetical protein
VEISAAMLRKCIDLGSAGPDGRNRGRLAQPFARGYMFGFSDACIQRLGVIDELESLALITLVHVRMFGHKIGSLQQMCRPSPHREGGFTGLLRQTAVAEATRDKTAMIIRLRTRPHKRTVKPIKRRRAVWAETVMLAPMRRRWSGPPEGPSEHSPRPRRKRALPPADSRLSLSLTILRLAGRRRLVILATADASDLPGVPGP